MNAGRPIFPEILEIALAASVVAIAVMIAHIYLFARWQSLIGKVLSTVGVVCLYSVIAAPLLGFALIGWYGGKPDAVASADGHFYVRQKYQLSPVSPAEYHRLQRLFDFDSRILRPLLIGAACLWASRLGRVRAPRAILRKLDRQSAARAACRGEPACSPSTMDGKGEHTGSPLRELAQE